MKVKGGADQVEPKSIRFHPDNGVRSETASELALANQISDFKWMGETLSLVVSLFRPSFTFILSMSITSEEMISSTPAYSEVHTSVGEDPETEIAVHLVKDCFVCEYGLR